MNHIVDHAIALAVSGQWGDLLEFLDANPGLATARPYDGSQSLLTMLSRLPGSKDVLRKMVSIGADVNDGSDAGNTPLSEAISGGSRFGLTTIPEIRTLVELGADINGRTYNGMPPLHRAIQMNRLDYAEVLIELGADPDLPANADFPITAEELARDMNSKESERIVELIKARSRKP